MILGTDDLFEAARNAMPEAQHSFYNKDFLHVYQPKADTPDAQGQLWVTLDKPLTTLPQY
jgi:hypothetical protein